MATVATDADFVATLMRGNRTLYSRLHEFNLLPTRSMHPSWRVALFPPSVQALLERSDLDARTHARLSAYLLEGPTSAPAPSGSPARGSRSPCSSGPR
jgi:hypothetical protein